MTTDFSTLGFSSETSAGLILDADGRPIVAGTASEESFSSFAVSCYDPGMSSVTVSVTDAPPVLRVIGNQVATAGQLLNLSAGVGSSTHA